MILQRKKLKNFKNKLNRQALKFKKLNNNVNTIEVDSSNFRFDSKI